MDPFAAEIGNGERIPSGSMRTPQQPHQTHRMIPQSSNPTPRTTGHIKVSTEPGAVQTGRLGDSFEAAASVGADRRYVPVEFSQRSPESDGLVAIFPGQHLEVDRAGIGFGAVKLDRPAEYPGEHGRRWPRTAAPGRTPWPPG